MYGYTYDGGLVGFLSLFVEEQIMYIKDTVILPAYQSNGFGSILMQFVKEQSKLRSCTDPKRKKKKGTGK